MAKSKKKAHDKSKARAADLARTTVGKARTFKDKSKAPFKADPEIAEGLSEYQDRVKYED